MPLHIKIYRGTIAYQDPWQYIDEYQLDSDFRVLKERYPGENYKRVDEGNPIKLMIYVPSINGKFSTKEEGHRRVD